MPQALTITANGRALVLMSEIGFSLPVENSNIKVFRGIWDTGATNSVITNKVVLALGLKPTGMREVHTANGKANQQTYLAHIYLPNQVRIINVIVTEAQLSPEFDCLIGMDVITLGDFAITNVDGKTKMSFRTPSMETIDYVKSLQNYGLSRKQRREREREQGKFK